MNAMAQGPANTLSAHTLGISDMHEKLRCHVLRQQFGKRRTESKACINHITQLANGLGFHRLQGMVQQSRMDDAEGEAVEGQFAGFVASVLKHMDEVGPFHREMKWAFVQLAIAAERGFKFMFGGEFEGLGGGKFGGRGFDESAGFGSDVRSDGGERKQSYQQSGWSKSVDGHRWMRDESVNAGQWCFSLRGP